MAGDDHTRTTDTGGDDGMAPGMEQFQQAALEAVRAARAMLDAAETAIRDPSTFEAVIRTAAGMARTATETVAGFAAGAVRDVPGDRPQPDDDADGDDDGYHDISVG